MNKIEEFLNLVESGSISAYDVLQNILVNYLPTDDAEDFIDTEYSDYFINDESAEDEDEF